MHQTEQHSHSLISGDRSSLLLFSAIQPTIHSCCAFCHVIHVEYNVSDKMEKGQHSVECRKAV